MDTWTLPLDYSTVVRILVTGGCGFIGSHLIDKLLLDGHQVIALDDLSTGSLENLRPHSNDKNLAVFVGSVLDSQALEDAVEDVDYIFHLAAAVGVFNIINKPLSSLLTNVKGTENVFDVASRYKIPVLIASSSEIYGKNTSNGISESDDRILGSPTTLRWSYSEAKAIDESIAFAYWVEQKLPIRIVRFFNTVGPRQLGTYGMVIPRFVEAALCNEPLLVFGDGEQTRCFSHILDTIDALVKVAFSEKTIGIAVNIGNSKEISINNLAKCVLDLTNSKSPIKHISYTDAYGDGFEDMEKRIPNTNLLRDLTSWEPKRDLNDIVKDLAFHFTHQGL